MLTNLMSIFVRYSVMNLISSQVVSLLHITYNILTCIALNSTFRIHLPDLKYFIYTINYYNVT